MKKICRKCGVEKELSKFYFRNDTGKYRNECKECFHEKTKITKKDWRKRKKEGNLLVEIICINCGKEIKTKFTNQKYCCLKCAYQYIDKHSEAKKRSSKLRRIRNREKIREYDRLRHIKNKDNINKIGREYHAKNREKINRKSRERYKQNKVAILEKRKKYRKQRKEKMSEEQLKLVREKTRRKNKKYYEKNKEKIKIQNKAYGQTPRGRKMDKNRHDEREVSKKETDITTEWLMQLREQAEFCEICRIKMNDTYPDSAQAQLDHIIPLNVGGEHVMKNVRYICAYCNNRRPRDGSDI